MRFLSVSSLDHEVSTFQGDFPRLPVYPISKKRSFITAIFTAAQKYI